MNSIWTNTTARLLRWAGMGRLWLFALLIGGFAPAGFSQTIYAIGDAPATTTPNTFYIFNPTAGTASSPVGISATLPATVSQSVAIGVSPINGLVYWVQRSVATPRFGTWNPVTGATTDIANVGTPAGVTTFLRATFCPDGRFYIAANGSAGGLGAEIYEINPATGALIRTITVSNLPTNGSGDIVCMSNGDMYMMAQSTSPTPTTGPYVLFRATAAQITTGGLFSATSVGTAGSSTVGFNGLSERDDGLLVASANNNSSYVISTTTAVATTLTSTVGAALADLSREFPRDIRSSKSVTPTAILQGNNTLTYTVTVANPGPAVAGSVTVADTLNPAVFNVAAATWTCAVTNAGASTAVTTLCGAASGTGNINSYVNLSIGATITYVLRAPLLASFAGTATNSFNTTLTGTTVDPNPSNNTGSVTSTVSPAANLTITKTNVVGSLLAGQTTSYTITVANTGPANAPNTIVRDVPTTGLVCTAATCTPTAGATCPAGTPAAIMAALLSPAGAVLPTFNNGASATFNVTCGVTATGLP
jgi:uncharacterized repeat protein (TIGR01451 family)